MFSHVCFEPPQVKGVKVDDPMLNLQKWRMALDQYLKDHHVVPNLVTLVGLVQDGAARH